MELLGETLLTRAGPAPTKDVVGGKVIGLYFSAHWCPPCRGFTPKLAAAYKDHLQAKNFEIVFVSSDRDEASFDEYFAEMPWAALPYADRDRKGALSKKFKVQGIPTLVLLDTDGSTITTDARSAFDEDPTGADFPWRPQPLSELLAAVRGKDGAADLEGKVVGLYFSAHWCPPCRGFTPKLVEQYHKITGASLPFEVVFVSSDRDEASFDEYYGEMPWAVLPYSERKAKGALSKQFGVSGIPSLVLLDKDRSTITTSGRGAVFGELEEFPWHPKPVTDLAESADGINEALSLVVLADGADAAAQAAAYAALEPVAVEEKAAAKASGNDPALFFLAKAEAGPVGQIRKLCGLEAGAQPAVVLLDIADNGGYYLPEVELTTQGLRSAIQKQRNGELLRKQLGG